MLRQTQNNCSTILKGYSTIYMDKTLLHTVLTSQTYTVEFKLYFWHTTDMFNHLTYLGIPAQKHFPDGSSFEHSAMATKQVEHYSTYI